MTRGVIVILQVRSPSFGPKLRLFLASIFTGFLFLVTRDDGGAVGAAASSTVGVVCGAGVVPLTSFH